MSPLACPHCRAPFAHLQLPGHYGARVQLDHCDACRLLWFDSGELGRLSPAGWTALLQHLVDHADEGQAHPARADAGCPHCRRGLQPVHDQTLYGRFVGLACPAGHGSAQRDAALFAARGLFRRLLPFELPLLAADAAEAVTCLACGAPRQASADDCSFCGSPPVVVDLKRLMQSLGLAERRSTLGQGQALLWSCQGCGQALDPAAQTACPQCQHPLVALRLDAVRPLLAQAAARQGSREREREQRARDAEAVISHERMKASWERDAQPRSTGWRLLLWLVRVLMSGRSR